MPDLTEDWTVRGEKSRLERVISNLIENALRHSPAATTVTIGIKRDGAGVPVTIDDEGPGIPQEMVSTLFEKFVQGQSGTGKLGLGLYFCHITVEQWEGTIGYTPRLEGGARFWFRLPIPPPARR